MDDDLETHHIRRVQKGYEDSFMILLEQYQPMLRGICRQVQGDRRDVEALTNSYFYECVMAHERGRLAKYKWEILNNVRKEYSLTAAVEAVPERTMQRYWSILRKADFDPVKAAAICQKHRMSVQTFLRIHALAWAESYDQITESDLEPVAEDAQELADLALASLTDDQERVVVHKWMGDDGTESDGVVSYLIAIEDLGEEAANTGQRVWSYHVIRRMRTAAMRQMRDALGVGS